MQLESPQSQVTVTLLVEQSLTERLACHRHAGCALEGHLRWREPPVRGTGDSTRRLVVFLMARRAQRAWDTRAVGPAHDAKLVDVPVIPLARIVGDRVAVDASGMSEDRFNEPPLFSCCGCGEGIGCLGRPRRRRR